jgi:phosphate:Na+ symporter
MNGPLESKGDQRRLASTLHALDHASRLAETVGEQGGFETASVGSSGVRALKLCAEAMRNAALIAGEITAPATARSHAAALEPELPEPPSAFNTSAAPLALAGAAIVRLEHCAKELDDLQRTHRSATLSAAADGELTASEAMARVDAVRRLAALGHHAWRAAAHLAGWGT